MLSKVVLLQQIHEPKTDKFYINHIMAAVCHHYAITEYKLKSQSRKRNYSDARSTAMYLIKQYVPAMTLKKMGVLFGGRDHTTIIYSLKKFNALNDTDASFRRGYEKILFTLNRHFNNYKAA
jgi:chromosomal replication initiator protein